VRGVNFHET
jgi:coatomer subunit alpha